MNPRRRLVVSGIVIVAAAVTLLAGTTSLGLVVPAAALTGLVAAGVFIAAWRRAFPGTGRRR